MNTYSEDKMYEKYSSEVERMQKCIDDLLQENKQLKDNWNKLREVIRKKQDYYRYVKDNRYRKFLSELLDKMQELQGSDSDE
jgi:regulator of replication initiation timing